MATTTLPTLRQETLRELDLGLLIPNAFFDAAAAGSITSANMLRNSNWGIDQFRSKVTVIFRPGAATSADFIRYAGDLTNTTGLLAHTGANYADTTVTSENVELWYNGIRPDREVLDALNRAHTDVFFDTDFALSHLSDLDGDMAVSTDSNWTDVGTPTTSAKSTTGRRTPYGLRSYQVVADAANEGTQTATLDVTTGKRVKGFTILSCDSGTGSFRLYDVTNSANADTAAITSSEETPQLVMQDWQVVSSTAREFAAQILGTVNPSSVFINMVWLYKEDELRINFPSYVTEHFQAPYISQARPTGSQTATNTWNARSLEFHELVEGKDYWLLFHHADANPYGVRFKDSSYFDWPLFVQARRPHSDRVTFSAETDSTECPVHLLKPRFKIEVIDTILLPRKLNSENIVYQRAKAQQEWERASIARPVKKESQRRPWGGIPRA